jgi:hypothetical protein
MTEWIPFREPLRVTLTRTIGIAVVAGLLITPLVGGITRWPAATLLLLWPSFGGHWIDLGYLNWLRPRLPAGRGVQRAARVAVWFAGGIVIGIGIRLTASAFLHVRPLMWLTWAAAGAAFVGIELVAHGGLQLRGRPSFYDGRG